MIPETVFADPNVKEEPVNFGVEYWIELGIMGNEEFKFLTKDGKEGMLFCRPIEDTVSRLTGEVYRSDTWWTPNQRYRMDKDGDKAIFTPIP